MSAQPREWLSFLQRFWPSALHVSPQEKLRMVLGAGLGVLFAGVLSQYLSQGAGPWLVAPIGASAVLVFGLPSSPLAQPWSVVGGNTLSALVGTAVAFVWNGDNLVLAGALAVALAVAIMLWSRCLHPPGGASALLVVLMGEPSWHLVLFAFFLSSVLLVVGGLIYNNLTGRSYPHHAKLDPSDITPPTPRFTQSDLDAALAHYQELIDVDPADLAQLLQYAESAAHQRTLGHLQSAVAQPPDQML